MTIEVIDLVDYQFISHVTRARAERIRAKKLRADKVCVQLSKQVSLITLKPAMYPIALLRFRHIHIKTFHAQAEEAPQSKVKVKTGKDRY